MKPSIPVSCSVEDWWWSLLRKRAGLPALRLTETNATQFVILLKCSLNLYYFFILWSEGPEKNRVTLFVASTIIISFYLLLRQPLLWSQLKTRVLVGLCWQFCSNLSFPVGPAVLILKNSNVIMCTVWIKEEAFMLEFIFFR